MKIEFINAFESNKTTNKKISELLQNVFDYAAYNGRIYFKQLPHYRILAWENDELIGHLGIDYRVMNLNEKPVKVFGIIDLAVDKKHRNKGIGKKLLNKMSNVANKNKNNIDFLLLCSDQPKYYEKLGFLKTQVDITWLKIDDHKNYGLGKEDLKTEAHFIMIKPISNKIWEDGNLDMLGYWY